MIRAMTAVVTTVSTAMVALGAASPVAATGPGTAARPAVTGPESADRSATGGAVTRPKIDLVLSYAADAGYAAAVTLTCDPVGGAHPKPATACAALKKAGGRPHKFKPAKTMCTLEYAPITAAITGTWKGRTVNWSKTFPNSCDLARATGVVFAF